jgi:hypothetical protein
MALLQLKPEAYAAGRGGEPSTASEADIARTSRCSSMLRDKVSEEQDVNPRRG